MNVTQISVVTRDEVGAYKPYLWEQSTFHNGVLFREWILTKIVNGERASYSAPKFARMQERTRSQMLEDIVANLQNHAETGQIPKPYRYMYIYIYVLVYIYIYNHKRFLGININATMQCYSGILQIAIAIRKNSIRKHFRDYLRIYDF